MAEKKTAKKVAARAAEKASADKRKKDYVFGAKQIMKLFKGKKKPEIKVFVAKDARETTRKALEKAEIPFETAKSKVELAQDMGLDFFCEVYAAK